MLFVWKIQIIIIIEKWQRDGEFDQMLTCIDTFWVLCWKIYHFLIEHEPFEGGHIVFQYTIYRFAQFWSSQFANNFFSLQSIYQSIDKIIFSPFPFFWWKYLSMKKLISHGSIPKLSKKISLKTVDTNLFNKKKQMK